jgi:formylglycine-generating enzyme
MPSRIKRPNELIRVDFGECGLPNRFVRARLRESWMSASFSKEGPMTQFQKLALLVLIANPARAADPPFVGSKAGDERRVAGVKLCWCPPGRFTMGSPPDEPERRPGEAQVEVRLTRGFWIGKYEVTQGDWKRVSGHLPGELTAELPAGDDYPVGNVNFAEAEGFCRKLTELAIASKELPGDWEFRLPTEAQWEYACRAGTTTATAFGDSLSRRQANFRAVHRRETPIAELWRLEVGEWAGSGWR